MENQPLDLVTKTGNNGASTAVKWRNEVARIDQVREKLAASLNDEGKPKLGYKLRVSALRRELDRLELEQAAFTVRTTARQDSGEGLGGG